MGRPGGQGRATGGSTDGTAAALESRAPGCYMRVDEEEEDRLLRAYWSIPERQVATSVVLADATWYA